MNFNNLNFLVYSSHKTCTQTLLSTFASNKYKSIHCHTISNLSHHFANVDITPNLFTESLINYKNKNKRKLKIITVVRNPILRLPSSFFQTFHTDEVNCGQRINNTTICLNNTKQLYIMYSHMIEQNILPGKIESIDEISNIFGINIIENLEKRSKYYYFEHELFELFVCDFNELTKLSSIQYLNFVLNTRMRINKKSNLSENKIYYQKYIDMKKMITPEINSIIINQYDPFYFNAFS